METREKSATQQIVPTSSQALAVRSAAIVVRGLRDLARDSNWLIKKIFTGHSSRLAISPVGQVCAVSPLVRQGTERVWLYDIELNVPNSTLAVPDEPAMCPAHLPAAFAYSPTARHLVAAWGVWPRELHVFDLHGKMFLGSFGEFSNFPEAMAWSDSGKHLAVATGGGKDARLQLWEALPESPFGMPFGRGPVSELGAPQMEEAPRAEARDAESSDDGTFAGFDRSIFSPEDGPLATVARMEGAWADDSIVLLEMPTLRRQNSLQAQGHITDLGWTFDSRELIWCAAGQSYRVSTETMQPEALPFGAELCACHPHFPLCLCFSSWLKNSAKGRLFLVDLERLAVFDEYPAEGVVDLRWSLDGSKAYAVTADGLAYIYEPPLL